MENLDKVKIDILKLGPDDVFAIDRQHPGRKIFIQVDFFDVAYIYSEENIGHEELAKAYVTADETLQRRYEKYKEKVEEAFYKDFLVLENDAIAVADKTDVSAPELVCNEDGGSGAMNKVLNAYLRAGYKFKAPKPALLKGTYGMH